VFYCAAEPQQSVHHAVVISKLITKTFAYIRILLNPSSGPAPTAGRVDGKAYGEEPNYAESHLSPTLRANCPNARQTESEKKKTNPSLLPKPKKTNPLLAPSPENEANAGTCLPV
jgi:hypothetical protein